MSTVLSDEKIPNNVNLGGDKRLQLALEAWQPKFIDWWKDMGPVCWQERDIYLRTAISVEANGWAHFDYVKMPEYRWGIFLEPKDEKRVHGFGDNMGQPVWDEVPGEFRNMLRRLVVTQGDTEPASVEQQRNLGAKSPFTPAAAKEAGLVTVVADEIDFEDELRIAIEERSSLSPDALTGMEASLRFPGSETMESKVFGRLSAWQNWIFIRPNAVGEEGALKLFGTGKKSKFDWKRV